MSPVYGFELRGGTTITVEAGDITEAMHMAEDDTGKIVQRGRCLDGFDNDAPEGRAELLAP